MRRNNSYSLQRVNPNINSNKYYILNAAIIDPEFRIQQGKGSSSRRWEIAVSTEELVGNITKKLILKQAYTQFSSGLGQNDSQMPRSKSENYLKLGTEAHHNQQTTKLPRIQNHRNLDSLDKLQMQISKKLVTESSPDKLHRQVDLLMPSTEVPHRKSSLNGLSSRNEFKIFTPIDKYYNEIHSPTRLKYTESNENTQRRLNPTYISSDLGYV